MGNIQQRAGGVTIRVGGNSQETAVLVNQTSDGRILEKDPSGFSNPVRFSSLHIITPPPTFSRADTNSTPRIHPRAALDASKHFFPRECPMASRYSI